MAGRKAWETALKNPCVVCGEKADGGTVYPGGRIEPLCTRHINEGQAERKAQLAAARKARRESAPVCDAPGCAKKAYHHSATGVSFCRKHATAARAGYLRWKAKLGIFAILSPVVASREDVLRWAAGE